MGVSVSDFPPSSHTSERCHQGPPHGRQRFININQFLSDVFCNISLYQPLTSY